MTRLNCCDCWNLKSGVIAIAIISLIFFTCCSCAVIYSIIYEAEQHKKDPVNFGYVLIPICIELVFYSCFLYGVIKEKEHFILPVLILEVIVWIVGGIWGIVVLTFPPPRIFLLLMGLGLITWFPKYRFYRNLTNNESPSDEIPVDLYAFNKQ